MLSPNGAGVSGGGRVATWMRGDFVALFLATQGAQSWPITIRWKRTGTSVQLPLSQEAPRKHPASFMSSDFHYVVASEAHGDGLRRSSGNAAVLLLDNGCELKEHNLRKTGHKRAMFDPQISSRIVTCCMIL